MSLKRIILVIDYEDDDIEVALRDRLHAAGEELCATGARPLGADDSILADFADRLEDIVQLTRRARARNKGKDSDDEH